MPGLVPGIHALLCDKEGVDGRDKPGHDGGGVSLGPEFTGFVSRVLDLFFII
jgi:hypothetical protein